MHEQMRLDPGWPPDYARTEDLVEWLGRPATLGRWVALSTADVVVGHVGLGQAGDDAAALLCTALECPRDRIAEICRIVVAPEARDGGLASRLTRQAMRSAIESGRVPASTVLENRAGWLAMMLETGWRNVGRVASRVPDTALVVLAPPQRFVDLALRAR